MASRGFLIRFIDIGLIVLFGFLMISEIELASQVELSVAVDAQDDALDVLERDFITVSIASDGMFQVEDTETGVELAGPIRQAAVLEGVLRRLILERSTDSAKLVVLIGPHEDSIVQRTVEAMDVCDRLRVERAVQLSLDGPRVAAADGAP